MGTIEHLEKHRDTRTLDAVAETLKVRGVTVEDAVNAARGRETGRKRKATFYLDPGLVKALRIAAADAGVSQGDLVGAILRDALMDPHAAPSIAALEILQRGAGAAGDVARELRGDGATLAEIAAALNRDGYRTTSGRRWSVVSVSRLLKRAS